MFVSTTSQYDTNPIPVQCCSTVAGAGQHLFNNGHAVLYAGNNVSTDDTLTPTQCQLNASPASSALANIYATLFSASRCLGAAWKQCTRYTDPAQAQCWARVADYCITPHQCMYWMTIIVGLHSQYNDRAPGLAQCRDNAGPPSATLTHSFWCWLYLKA